MADKILGVDFTDETTPTSTTTISGHNGTNVVDIALSNLHKALTYATASNINTGTDTVLPLNSDALAGSVIGTKAFSIEVFGAATSVATGDGKKYIPIPPSLEGMNIISVGAEVFTKSTSGNPTVMIARGRQASATTAHVFNDMLTTALTIDANDYDSADATTAAVIGATYDDLAEGDLLRIDVDTAGTGTQGLWIRFEARLP